MSRRKVAASSALLIVMATAVGCDGILGVQEYSFEAGPGTMGDGSVRNDARVDAATDGRDAADGGNARHDATDGTIDAHDAPAPVDACTPFTLHAPASLVVYEQLPAPFTVSATRCPGFTGPIAVSLGTLPAGIGASMTSVVLDESTPSATITLTPALGIAFGTVPLQLQAVAVGVPDETAIISIEAEALPNGLDRTFNGTGSVVTLVEGSNSVVESLAVDGAGNVVVAADNGNFAGQAFVMGRYLSSGPLDTTFGGQGIVSTAFPTNNQAGAEAVVLAPNGTILAAGDVIPNADPSQDSEFAAAIYDAQGNLETSVVTSITYQSLVYAAALDGTNLLVVGNDVGHGIDLERYTSTGTRDATFGTSGGSPGVVVINGASLGSLAVKGLALTSDRHILLAGGATDAASPNFILARLMPDTAAIDLTFGTTSGAQQLGYVVTPISTGATAATGVAIASDGSIFVCGTTDDGGRDAFVVVAYTADGLLNTSFGQGGLVTTHLGTFSDAAAGIAIDASGNLLVAGTTQEGDNSGVGLVRYSAETGALDTSFGNQGIVRSVDTTTFNVINALAVEADGKVVVGGSQLQGDTRALFVARYNAQ